MVEFCEGTLDTLMERLCSSISSIDQEWIKRCVPATEEQIQQLQDIFAANHYTIPSAYLQYLKVMGQDDGGLLEYVVYGGYEPDIETVLDILTDDIDVRKDLEEGFFMISFHWTGDPAFYLKLSPINDNPIVTDSKRNDYAGSFEKFLFHRAFVMYQETFIHCASDNGNDCHEKKEEVKCKNCLHGMTAEERMDFMISFAESYGVKKVWFSDQMHFYAYDINYALEVRVYDGYSIRFSYNDDKLFESAYHEFKKIGIYLFEQDTERNISETDIVLEEVPQLPDAGGRLEDFIPEGWKILSCAELDFNEDGITDYVGVLETVSTKYGDYPRILFAIASDGADRYRLDFQNDNLIQTRAHGLMDVPLTAQGTSFTIRTAYNQMWEDYTYTYREGVWWLTSSEYAFALTSYHKNDWESGIGIRKQGSRLKRSYKKENIGKTEYYDVLYELTLDKPLTLEQAGKRNIYALDRITDWEVASITLGQGVELLENMVPLPDEADIDYCDEDYVLYIFSDLNEEFAYLAVYCWQNKTVSVLVKEKTLNNCWNHLQIYKGKIYYCTWIEGNVIYKTVQDGKEQITQQKGTIGIMFNRINLYGTEKEIIFEYRYPHAEQKIWENTIPFLTLEYEISGDEIVIELCRGNEPRLFYRMKTDGSGRKMIGQISDDWTKISDD